MIARIRFSPALCTAFLMVSLTPVLAQIHGVPSSVTSFGFGGSRSMTPGTPASVTSLGPNGFHNSQRFFGNPFFTPNTHSHVFVNGPHGNFRRRNRGAFFGGVPVYAVPYYGAYGPDYENEDDDDYAQPGPTVFERHGGLDNNRMEARYPQPIPTPPVPEPAPGVSAPSEPVSDQPSTVLVFKDGHQTQVQNYAIVSDTLFDLSDGRPHKIQLADLDLTATQKANDDRGVDFQVPAKIN